MFFGSAGKRALIGSMEPVLLGFRKSVDAALGEAGDRDTTLLFVGLVHYAISFYSTNQAMRINPPKWIKPAEIPEVLTQAALMIRKHAPLHGLGNSFIESTMHDVVEATRTLGPEPSIWPAGYYASVKHLLRVDEGLFLGALTRESAAVVYG